MATYPEQWEDIAQAGQGSLAQPVVTSSEPPVGEGPFSSSPETEQIEHPGEGVGTSTLGTLSGQEGPISEEEIGPATTSAAGAEIAQSPPVTNGPEEASSSRAATPRPTATRETIPGMPPLFPSPPAVMPTGPFGVHRGPASSSSLSSYHAPLNPLAPSFAPRPASQNLAEELLRRGPPPGTRDPMDIPEDHAAGNVMADPAATDRRLRSAIRHAAMVYRRLIATDSVIVAGELDQVFARHFGQDYQNAVINAIAMEDDDTDESENEDDSVD